MKNVRKFSKKTDLFFCNFLKELYRSDTKPVNTVDGWNAWFFSNMENLRQIWNGRNQKSVAELWIGFLEFYAAGIEKKHLNLIHSSLESSFIDCF